MRSCPRCSSSNVTRDGHDQRGRSIHACGACGGHATAESTSLVSGHRFPRVIILLAVRCYLQPGAAAERIAGILADRGIGVSGRTIRRSVQKFGPALSEEIRWHRKPVSTTWLMDETHVKILGMWHYLYRGVDQALAPLKQLESEFERLVMPGEPPGGDHRGQWLLAISRFVCLWGLRRYSGASA
jgi:transposase-like protein